MHKSFPPIILIGLMLHAVVSAQPTQAKGRASSQVKHESKVKTAVSKLGVGPAARVGVKLYDGRKASGFIREIRGDGFVIADVDAGGATEVDYKEVKQLRGHNLSTGAKVAIGVGIAVAVLVILALIGLHYGD